MNKYYLLGILRPRKLLKVVIFTLVFTSLGISNAFANSSGDELMSTGDALSEEAQSVKKEPHTLRGAVTDELGAPLIGVSVSVKGTTRGVATDINGYYILEVEAGEVVLFNYVGFKSKELILRKGQESLNITLEEDVRELDEVVVVGMGTQRKASVIGSISTVNLQELKVSQPSLTANLSGRIAGTVAVQRSGEPGIDATDFWIRGIATFGTNQKPLTLIDGVERDINDISVDEIESISILKDASATAVYGVRAANGVVVITTKRGIAQKPRVEVKLEYGLSDLPKVPKYLGSPDYARLSNEAAGRTIHTDREIALMENPTEWYHPYLYPNTNWFDEVFKKWSNNFTAGVNINGGSERARYYIAGAYMDNKGNMRDLKDAEWKSNPQQKRYNFRSNIDVNLSKSTILNIEIGANLTDLYQPGEGNRKDVNDKQFWTPAERIFTYANLASPMFPAYFPGVTSEGERKWLWGAPPVTGQHNPAERLFNSGYAKQQKVYAMTQAVLTQKLDFVLEGLEAKGSFSFDYFNNAMQFYRRNAQTYAIDRYVAAEDLLESSQMYDGQDVLNYSRDVVSNRAIEAKFQLLYDKIFNKVHRVGAMFMYHQREKVDAVDTGAAGGGTAAIVQSLPYRKQGIAARATYSYDDRYFAEFNIGYNGSENFPKDNRFGVFPAGAVGYLLSNESFWKVDFVNLLKLRGSIGLVGNESLAMSGDYPLRFGYQDVYGAGNGGYNWGATSAGATTGGLGLSQVGVANLTWEKGLKKNIGVELKMWDNKIALNLDVFHEKRTDILIRRSTIPDFAGYGSASINANLGEMKNRGFETDLSFSERIQDFNMRFWGNFTYAANKVVNKDEAIKPYEYMMERNHRFGQQFGLIDLGLFRDQDDIDNHTPQNLGSTPKPGDVKYLDYNGDGVVDIYDKVAIGYSNIPEISYGFGAQFSWKNFDLGVFFRGQDRVSYRLGGAGYVPFMRGVGNANLFTKALDRWTEENPDPNAFYPRLTDGSVDNNWAHNSTRNIYNGRFIRLDHLEFGYTFTPALIAPIGVKGLRVYFSGHNLAVFSKWKLWDPETASQNGAQYPISRHFNFGVKANF